MSTTIFATLPNSLEIDGVVHVTHWRTHNHVVYQNYSGERATSNDPLGDRAPQIVGQNLFHVFRVIQHNPGEELGEELGSYTSLQAAIDLVEREEQFA